MLSILFLFQGAVPPEPPPRHENFQCQFGTVGAAVAVEFDLADTEPCLFSQALLFTCLELLVPGSTA